MRIHENNLEHLSDFIALNEEWIRKYFSIEEEDRKLAANPSKIIKNGGYVLSLVLENDVVGVCALFNEGNGSYELARMAVSPLYQGKGLGQILLNASLIKARSIKAKKIHLVSNTKLTAAIALYKKSGFVTTKTGRHPLYARANVSMELKNP